MDESEVAADATSASPDPVEKKASQGVEPARVESETTVHSTTVFCVACGAEIASDAQFCKACGATQPVPEPPSPASEADTQSDVAGAANAGYWRSATSASQRARAASYEPREAPRCSEEFSVDGSADLGCGPSN